MYYTLTDVFVSLFMIMCSVFSEKRFSRRIWFVVLLGKLKNSFEVQEMPIHIYQFFFLEI